MDAGASATTATVVAIPAEPTTELPNHRHGREGTAVSNGVAIGGAGNDSGTGLDRGSGTGSGGGASGSPVETPFAYGSNPPPPYPTTARRRGWEGEVLLLVTVTAQGQVSNVATRRSSGYRVLDQAAEDAVALWRFQPASRNGRAVPGLVLVPVRFSLKKTR